MVQSYSRQIVAISLVVAGFASIRPAVAQSPGAVKDKQLIRLEATPDGRTRLQLDGPEAWTAVAEKFEARVEPNRVRLVAQPLDVTIQTPRTRSIANEFELLIKTDGSLGFTIRDSRQVK